MALYRPVQTAFNGGVLSKHLRGRLDLPIYHSGMESCFNWQPTPQGAIRARPGTQFAEEVDAGVGRIFGVRMSDGKDFVLALGESKLYAFDEAGYVPLISNLVVNGDFNAGFSGWTEVDAGSQNYELTDIVASRAAVQFYGSAPGGIPAMEHGEFYQNIAITQTGTYTFKFDVEMIASNAYVNLALRVKVYDGATLCYQRDFTEGQAPQSIEASFTLTNGNTCKIVVVDISTEVGAVNNTQYTSGYVDNLVLAGQVAQSYLTSPYTASQLSAVRHAVYAAEDTIIFVHPLVPPWEVSYDTSTGAWSAGNITFSGAGTSEWATGNYPGLVEIHQNRTYWSAAPFTPSRIWASNVGAPYDHTQGTNPSDAFVLNLSTRGAVRWLSGQGSVLLVGTDLEEFSLTGSQGYITPSDVQARRQSTYGSRNAPVTWAGSGTLYLGPDGKQLRMLGYSFEADQWRSPNIALTGEVLDSPGKELTVLTSPFESLVVLREDGAFDICTFDPGAGIAAWWSLTLRVGSVATTCSTRGVNGDVLWMVVDRGGFKTLEFLRLEERDLRLDGHVYGTVVDNAGTLEISGLAHLEGQTVTAVKVVAGMDYESATGTVTSGVLVVTTPLAEGDEVVVGIPCAATFITLRRVDGLRDGTGLGAKHRDAKVGVLLLGHLVKVNGERVREEDGTAPVLTEEYDGRFSATGLGYERDGRVTVEADLPGVTEVLALYASTRAEGV